MPTMVNWWHQAKFGRDGFSLSLNIFVSRCQEIICHLYIGRIVLALFKCVKEMHIVIQSIDVIWCYLTLSQKYFTVGEKMKAKVVWPTWWKMVPKLKSVHKRTTNYRVSVTEVFEYAVGTEADYKRYPVVYCRIKTVPESDPRRSSCDKAGVAPRAPQIGCKA